MIGHSYGCWSKKDRIDVIDFIKPILHRFLFREALPNLEIPLKNLTGLTDDELHLLKTIHFLLSNEVDDLIKELPKIIRNLSHSTHKELIECRGVIRGRIDWNMTFKERYSQGFNDPSLFICQPSTKLYDLPENQLLNFVLWKIKSLTENIDLDTTKDLLFAETWENWQDKIINSYLKVKKFSKNIFFQQISMPRSIKPKTVQKTYKNRNRSYHAVAKCYELYEKLFILNDQNILRELIEKQTLEPLNNDKLFEVYVLTNILRILDESDGRLEIGLLMPGLDYTARYMNGEKEISVYYQKMPGHFYDCSRNKEIFQFYDLNVSMRRPDIILKFNTPENLYYQLIEVKRTEERGYIVDSVYKVLGYIHDFEDCLKNTPKPQGILVVWDGVTIQEIKNALTQPVLILKDKDMEKGFRKILSLDG